MKYPPRVIEMVESEDLSLEDAIQFYEIAYGPITEESI